MAELSEAEGSVLLTPEQEDELWGSLQQIRRGEFSDGDELLAELKTRLQS